MKKCHGKCIKILRSGGGKYLLGEFLNYLLEEGIESQLSAPGMPQENGVAKRRNITLMDMVRSTISYLDLPNSFWGHALKIATNILNLVLSMSVPTPTKLWNGSIPSLQHVRMWHSPLYVLKGKLDKLKSSTYVCFFCWVP